MPLYKLPNSDLDAQECDLPTGQAGATDADK
jgi:hypothetical protein